MNITQFKQEWRDEPDYHTHIHETFISNVNDVEWMKEHRDFVEQKAYGFGERSFYWLWKLLVDEMPSEFSFLEVGVFRGQILSLIKMLASATGRSVQRYGVTPLDTSGGVWESDYKADIEFIHDKFFVPKDYTIFHGSSTDMNIILKARDKKPYELVYIDGAHDKESVDSDLLFYAPMVNKGGYLVIDDSNCEMSMKFGMFQGIQDATDAKLEWVKKQYGFEFVCSVVHISVFKRIK